MTTPAAAAAKPAWVLLQCCATRCRLAWQLLRLKLALRTWIGSALLRISTGEGPALRIEALLQQARRIDDTSTSTKCWEAWLQGTSLQSWRMRSWLVEFRESNHLVSEPQHLQQRVNGPSASARRGVATFGFALPDCITNSLDLIPIGAARPIGVSELRANELRGAA